MKSCKSAPLSKLLHVAIILSIAGDVTRPTMQGVWPSFHAAMTAHFDILEIISNAAGLPYAFRVHYIESRMLTNSVMHMVSTILYIVEAP